MYISCPKKIMKEEKNNNNNKMLLQGLEGNCGRGQNVYKVAARTELKSYAWSLCLHWGE